MNFNKKSFIKLNDSRTWGGGVTPVPQCVPVSPVCAKTADAFQLWVWRGHRLVGSCYIFVHVTCLDNRAPFANELYLANEDGIEMAQTGRKGSIGPQRLKSWFCRHCWCFVRLGCNTNKTFLMSVSELLYRLSCTKQITNVILVHTYWCSAHPRNAALKGGKITHSMDVTCSTIQHNQCGHTLLSKGPLYCRYDNKVLYFRCKDVRKVFPCWDTVFVHAAVSPWYEGTPKLLIPGTTSV